MKKFMPLTKEQVKELPQYVQDKVADILKAFDECNIVFENGEYRVSTSIAITATYAPDHKVIGYVYQDDFYTIEERKKNYFEEFGEKAWWLK